MTPRMRNHPRHQRGIITAMAAVILIAAVLYVLNQSFGIIGTTSNSNVVQHDSVAAFLAAESGVEAAKGVISTINEAGGNVQNACNGLPAQTSSPNTPYSVTSGTFEFLSGTCGDAECSDCTVMVSGKSANGGAERRIEIVISTVSTQGSENCGDKPSLSLTATQTSHGIFTNLAYRAKTITGMCGGGGGSNANIGKCYFDRTPDPDNDPTTHAGVCAPTTEGWSLERTGTNNVSGLGVFTTINTFKIGDQYTINQELVDNSGNPAPRNYVQTGVIVSPLSGSSPDLIGSYGSDTGANKTTGTSAISSSVPSNWNCAEDSGTAALERAAGAGTLLYGFSSWPANPNSQLSAVTFGTQPLRRQLSMTGNQGDHIYSQIWYSYNHAYYTTGATSGATNGATFSGALGGVVTGSIDGTTLTVTSNTSGGRYGQLSAGDRISGAGVTANTEIAAAGCTGTTTPYTCGVNHSQTVASTALTAQSNVLRVTALASGIITVGDTINRSGTDIATVSSFPSAGMTGMGFNGNYRIGAHLAPFDTTTNMYSYGQRIYLPVATGGAPLDGTAIAVASGNGAFGSATLTGSINGKILTVTACSSGTPSIGDALFGSTVKPDTHITAGPVGTACNGTYDINTEHGATSSTTIMSRAAVDSGLAEFNGGINGNTLTVASMATGSATIRVGNAIWSLGGIAANTRIMSQLTGTPGGIGTYMVCAVNGTACNAPGNVSGNFQSGASSNFFIASRIPSPRLSNTAQLCGGICMMLKTGTDFFLTNITTGDDWASGFACVTGVDPTSIKTLGVVSTRRTTWREVVR